MHIFTRRSLNEFAERHADAKSPLARVIRDEERSPCSKRSVGAFFEPASL
jgi:hypothetical protein